LKQSFFVGSFFKINENSLFKYMYISGNLWVARSYELTGPL